MEPGVFDVMVVAAGIVNTQQQPLSIAAQRGVDA